MQFIRNVVWSMYSMFDVLVFRPYCRQMARVLGFALLRVSDLEYILAIHVGSYLRRRRSRYRHLGEDPKSWK